MSSQATLDDMRAQAVAKYGRTPGAPVMATSILEQFSIAQFIEWYESGQLILNPDFQRRQVWTPAAKVFLIDTILRRFPVPKVYLRTQINLVTKKSYREVVDGQQRLRAIVEFAQDKFALSKRAGEYAGLRYSNLDDDLKQSFLSYPIAVDQLVNADDSDVLEVFARLNSYTVSLNAQEKRHGRFSGAFRWAVHNTSKAWASRLWERTSVVSKRQRLRMYDDALMAEMFIILLKGVTDGGESNIDKVYKELDKTFPEEEEITERVNATLGFMVDNLSDVLSDTTVAKGPHFLMLFAACAHALFGIPQGAMGDAMPERRRDALGDLDTVRENVLSLDDVLQADESVEGFGRFWTASKSSTHRIASRQVRFPVYYQALLPDSINS